MDTDTRIQVRVTIHAHDQYCTRVEPIGRKELADLCTRQLEARDYDYRHGDFICLSGVWWVYKLEDDAMTLITCYGKSMMHIPKAIKWAIRNNDRINLAVTL